jgi:hypothetical protein
MQSAALLTALLIAPIPILISGLKKKLAIVAQVRYML